jgi:signal transduction histidine kinase
MTRKMKAEGKKIRFQFLSVLSHELKSPINTVESYLHIIKDRQAGNQLEDYDLMIDRSLDRIQSMRTLILDMLDFTKIESGRKTRNITEIDIIEIAKTAIISIETLAKEKEVEIITNFPDILLMKADAQDYEIMFNNLLSNAVKYNKQKGKIIFTIKLQNQKLIIEVEDTGIGMTDEEKSHLFEEFMRAKNAKTRNISGTGLGLSIMKKIVDLNNGSIKVDSKPDVGSKFRIIIKK